MGFGLSEIMQLNRNKAGLRLIPTATYRIQLNSGFGFETLKNVLPFLENLGISHVYSSPIFKARPGSTHGYDILDSNQINEELGGSSAFDVLMKEAASLGLEWIQDIVPNHVAYSPDNPLISNTLSLGSDSIYHNFLDVDWNYPSPKLRGKVLAPFLTENLKQSMRQRKIRLSYSNGFKIEYGNLQFPVKIGSYKRILENSKFFEPLFKDKKNIQAKLQSNYDSDPILRSDLSYILKQYNTNNSLLKELISEQNFVLARWQSAFKEINYRRFFDIIDLICLRMEQDNAFETTHELIIHYLSENEFAGVRVDHIDGLFDPEKYLNRLRKAAPNAYIIVEKILLGEEKLPASWPIQGSTGYDFLNKVNGLFVEEKNQAELSRLYSQFSKTKQSLDKILSAAKKSIIRTYFGGDIKNLTRLFQQVLKEKFGKNYKKNFLKAALVELISSFDVYRTYLSPRDLNREKFEKALQIAKIRNKKSIEVFEAIELLLKDSSNSEDSLRLFMRLQQFSGAVMAKGLEDTVFYTYNRLLSLCEVGGNLEEFGVTKEKFESFLDCRQEFWPFSLNATSTHDTKRGEDSRARLNVLSEIPSMFSEQVEKWANLNFHKKKKLKSKLVPSSNEEYYFYQSIIGAFPFEIQQLPEFAKRMELHMTKMVREAKKNSTWISPKLDYEQALSSYVSLCLYPKKSNIFLQEFLSFHKKIALCGATNSLSQTLIKVTSPGVPDFYQGSELWDLNLVDPDNRRPIDYIKRRKYLKEIKDLKIADFPELLESFDTGKIKLFVISRALKIRKQKRILFQDGAFIPLKVEGELGDCVIAFCRKLNDEFAITVCPRFSAKITGMDNFPLGEVWKDTFVCLPSNFSKDCFDVFSEKSVISQRSNGKEGFYIEELFQSFPFALLIEDGALNE